MPQQRIYLRTTEVPADRSAADVLRLLVLSGAQQVLHNYGPDRRLLGLSFSLVVDGRRLSYRLPVRPEPIFTELQRGRRQHPERYAERDREQAERIAWRQVFMWLQAQLALIDTGMATPDEVFTGYLMLRGGQTLHERLASDPRKLLPAIGAQEAE